MSKAACPSKAAGLPGQAGGVPDPPAPRSNRTPGAADAAVVLYGPTAAPGPGPVKNIKESVHGAT